MEQKIYCYRDKVLQSYNAPLFVTDAEEVMKEKVIRGLLKADTSTLVNMKDLALYLMGTFDDESGKFNLVEPVKLLDCEDYIRKAD